MARAFFLLAVTIYLLRRSLADYCTLSAFGLGIGNSPLYWHQHFCIRNDPHSSSTKQQSKQVPSFAYFPSRTLCSLQAASCKLQKPKVHRPNRTPLTQEKIPRASGKRRNSRVNPDSISIRISRIDNVLPISNLTTPRDFPVFGLFSRSSSHCIQPGRTHHTYSHHTTTTSHRTPHHFGFGQDNNRTERNGARHARVVGPRASCSSALVSLCYCCISAAHCAPAWSPSSPAQHSPQPTSAHSLHFPTTRPAV